MTKNKKNVSHWITHMEENRNQGNCDSIARYLVAVWQTAL